MLFEIINSLIEYPLSLAIILSAISHFPEIEAQMSETESNAKFYNPSVGFVEDRNIRSVSFQFSIDYRTLGEYECVYTKYVRVRGRPFRFCLSKFVVLSNLYLGVYLVTNTGDDTGNESSDLVCGYRFKNAAYFEQTYSLRWDGVTRTSGESYRQMVYWDDLTESSKGYLSNNILKIEISISLPKT